METLTDCPICAASDFEKKLVCKDYTVSQESFQLVGCKNCGLVFTNPRPEEKELGRYYESDDYISHSNTSKGIVNSLYQWVRKRTLAQKLKLVNSLSSKGKLLDVGCGTGEFLNTCKNDGWQTIGIEPSSVARQYGIDNYKLDVRDESELTKLEPGSFDIITLWHVLEHVPHLQQRAAELKSLIRPGGVLIIAVPNRLSHDAEYYQQYWAAYDVPRHLYHFSAEDIRFLFAGHGFQMLKVLPMRYDAYYVSMLSEKYRTGKTRMIAAFCRGWMSNMKASGKPRYSSQIYILKREG